ncbi:hypothetical protein HOLleu_00083 [Holothuria leucospilota]|uniref:Uncharacterized protein n=1 Tax=Holothuria leucospilota TaxID=206669 RepID=A0A9Q1HJF4_HOLLE|nr:hypothetical protein HOLleu_00083 [Holothuria leucospilota]
MAEDDRYEQYNYDDAPVKGGSSGKGRTKKEIHEKEHMFEEKKTAKTGRKVEDQITNAEKKQKEKLKKQSSKD